MNFDFREVLSIDDNDMSEWKSICKEWCRQNGATLLFVNNTGFGCEMSNGQLRHIYIDEFMDMLK